MAIDALVVLLVAVATYTDLRERKIYNNLTYPGILGGLGLNAIGSLVERAYHWSVENGAGNLALIPPLVVNGWRDAVGWVGIESSALGLAACGGSMVVCYALFRIGGGDVKLLAMIGACLGLERGVETLLWTFVVGGAVALATLIWRVGAWRLATRFVRQAAWSLGLAFWSRWGVGGPLSVEERRELEAPLYLAPSALAGLLIVLASRQWRWF